MISVVAILCWLGGRTPIRARGDSALLPAQTRSMSLAQADKTVPTFLCKDNSMHLRWFKLEVKHSQLLHSPLEIVLITYNCMVTHIYDKKIFSLEGILKQLEVTFSTFSIF